MPLSEKVRIEVYLPDLSSSEYRNLLRAFEIEFTHTFGGCTVISGLDGSYLSQGGLRVRDQINLIYTDAPFALNEHFAKVARYSDRLREAAFEALAEEAVLVVVVGVYRSE